MEGKVEALLERIDVSFFYLIMGKHLQCKEKGGVWGDFGARFNWCFFEKDRSKCLDEGGEWKPVGMALVSACVRHSNDGGKPCTDPSQCEFKRCYYQDKSENRSTESTDNVVGECASTNDPFGCHHFVVNGRVVRGGCRD